MIFNDRFPLFDESQEFTLVKTMVYPFIAIPSVHFFEHGQNSTNDGIRHFCDWKVLDLAPGKMPDTCSCAACTVNCFDVTSGYQWLPVVTSGLPVVTRYIIENGQWRGAVPPSDDQVGRICRQLSL